MPTFNTAHHHMNLRKRIHQKKEAYPHPTKLGRILDKIIYASAIIIPLLNAIQLYWIWTTKSADGLSLPAWIGFAFFSLMWMFYGIFHKEKPIIALNAGLFIVQVLITLSIFHFA